MRFKFIKIVIFVPSAHADKVREALAEAGAGHVGNYDRCSFSVKGVGRFRPLKGSKPFMGEPVPIGKQAGKIEEVEEERIETICPCEKLDEVLAAVKAAHPYEKPAIDVCPLLNCDKLTSKDP